MNSIITAAELQIQLLMLQHWVPRLFFLTILGKDSGSRELTEVLKKHKVNIDYLIRDKGRTTIAKEKNHFRLTPAHAH